MISFLKKHKILLIILLLALFLRVYRLEDLLTYSHDQDLAGWFVRDVWENKHLRLIGQETSTAGIFIGALFYYMLIPFYLLFGMETPTINATKTHSAFTWFLVLVSLSFLTNSHITQSKRVLVNNRGVGLESHLPARTM